MTFFQVILFVFLTTTSALGAEEDLKKEEYLHNIYKRYHSKPTSQALWEKALAQRESQKYTIVKGDTLWDVSKTLFDDGFFWSKVWALNPFITNPHLISSGQVINFYHGEGLDAPGLKVTESEKGLVITPQSTLSSLKWWQSQDLVPPPMDLKDVVIPPPLRVYPKVLETFPASIPNWYFQAETQKKGPKIEIVPVERPIIESILTLPFFISDHSPDEKGRVHEIEKNAVTAAERDFLFIDADEDLEVGSTYTVIRDIGKIRDPEVVFNYPLSYEVQGEVKIVGKLEGLYKAIVTLSIFPIQVDSIIVPGSTPKMNLTESGTPSNIKGMIVGGENDTTRSLFGPQSIIYINRGSADGIKVNQQAPIMAVHRMRHPDSSLYSNTWKLGEVKIVKVEENYSTGVIMESTDGIVPGDMVGEFGDAEMTAIFKELNSSTSFGFHDDQFTRGPKRLDKSEEGDSGSGQESSLVPSENSQNSETLDEELLNDSTSTKDKSKPEDETEDF